MVVWKNRHNLTNQWTRWEYCSCLCHRTHSLPPPPGCPSLAGWLRTLCHKLGAGCRQKHLVGPGEHACEPTLCRGDKAVLAPCRDIKDNLNWQMPLESILALKQILFQAKRHESRIQSHIGLHVHKLSRLKNKVRKETWTSGSDLSYNVITVS